MTDPASTKTAPKTLKARADKIVTTVGKTASKAAGSTSGTARDLAQKTTARIESNPVATLAGGVVLGAIAAAFLPRSEREAKLLSPVGKRLGDTARGALDAARDTARNEFDVLGLSRNAARDQIGKLLGGVVDAITAAGTAALAAKVVTLEPAAPAPAPKPATRKTAPKKAKLAE